MIRSDILGIEETALARLTGLTSNRSALKALAPRGNVVAMIEAAEAAVLRPGDCGGLSHSLRAAIACRASHLNGHPDLAGYYISAVSAEDLALCDPAFSAETDRLRALLSFTDMITLAPRGAQADDIETLKQAGISDADIVRLCELNAFLAFQYRVIVGLSLMNDAA